MESGDPVATLDPAALRARARDLRRARRPVEAAAIERQALAASVAQPDYAAAAQALDAGDPERARSILMQLLARDGTDVLALTMLGMQWTSAM